MNDSRKNKAQLITELKELRARLSKHEAKSHSEFNEASATLNAERLKRGVDSRYQNIIDASLEGIWIVDAEATTTFVNDQLARMLGYRVDEMLQRSVFDFIHEGDWREARQHLERGKHGLKERRDFQFRRKDRSSVWTMVSTTPLFDDNGTFVGGLAMLMDVSDRKRAELTLRESEIKFRALAETTAAAIYIYRGLNLIYVNPTAEAQTGYSREELLKKSLMEVVHPEFRELVKERALARQRGEHVPSRYEFKILTKTGETRWVDAAASSVEYKGKSAAIGTAFDITDRKRAEEELHKSQARLQHVISSSPAIVYALRVEGTRLIPDWVSDSITRLTGYTVREALIEGWWSGHLHPDDKEQVLADLRRLFDDDRVVLEYRFQHKDEGYHWIHDELHLYRDESGNAIEGIGSWSDVTERREAERALRASEERYRDMVENARDIIYTHDLEGNYTAVNQAVERITGYTREEALKLNFSQVVAPEYQQTARRMLADKLGDEKETDYDLDIIAKDGRRLTVAVNTRLVRQDGVAVGIQGIARDVTFRKQAVAELRKQREILQKIIDNIPVMIRFRDVDGRISLVNREWERTLGWTLDEIRNGDLNILADAYPDPIYRQRVLDFMAAARGEWSDFKTRTKDGRLIDTSWSNFRLSDGTRMGFGRDITEQKRAEESLRRQTERLGALHDIELEISAESELSRVLDVVTRRAAELLRVAHCNTYIYDREHSMLELAASLDSYSVGLQQKPGEGLAGVVVVTGCAQAIGDYSKWDGRAVVFDGKGFGPALGAPLKWQDTVIGAISMARERGSEPFTQEDSLFLEQIAAEAAIAIHQASLFQDLQAAHSRLQVLSHSLIDAQEAERKLLARELHDRIGQALTAVQISLQTLRSEQSESRKQLDASLAVIEDALSEVHNLSLELRPSLLDDLGLVAALNWYIDRIAIRAKLLRCFHADSPKIRLAPEIETACFRIAQEALTNVVRHAKATTVWVELRCRESSLNLSVIDDGFGFAVQEATSRTGPYASLGLQGMRERAGAVGGEVAITSRPGEGTKIRATFPLHTEVSEAILAGSAYADELDLF